VNYTNLQIIFYPDPRLRKISPTVTKFDAQLNALAQRMFELMREEQGVGLAAPQVGVNLRMFVMNPTGEPDDDQVIVNPVLLDADGNEPDDEGCLSLPKIRTNVDRATSLRLKAQTVTGQPIDTVLQDFEARVVQHEVDHLNGILLIDRMGFTSRMGVRKRLRDMELDYEKNQPTRNMRKTNDK